MAKQLASTLFVEKFRPISVDDVLMPASYKKYFKQLIEDKEAQNLLLYSSYPGSGKTSLAKAICNDLGVEPLYINVSSESGIDTLRGTISQFASRRKINGMKQIVILDECDGASAQLMKGLRSAIEEFHNSCGFILTCNNVNSIIPPLRSRCQEFNFNMNKEEFRNEMIPKVVKRVGLVLKSESIEFDQEAVELLVKERYPDIRKIYGILQQYSKMNGLIDKNVLNFVDVDDKLYELVLTKKLTLARQYILDAGYDWESLYTDFYKNLIPRIDDKQKQLNAIRVIADWYKSSAFCSDKEIPFVAMMLDLMGEI